MARFHKHDAAKSQLVTAVSMFLEGRDRSSVITLAGAASEIFDALVRRSGKEPFLDYARRVRQVTTGEMPKRSSFGHHVNARLGITVHKHLWEGESDTVELDLDVQAADAVSRAIADYIELNGQDETFVKAFLQWSWINQDGPAKMEKFKQAPEKLKPRT